MCLFVYFYILSQTGSLFPLGIMEAREKSRISGAKNFGEMIGQSGCHLNNGFEGKGTKGKILNMSGKIIHQVLWRGRVHLGDERVLPFNLQELVCICVIWLGRDFTRVMHDREMVMSLGVNSRSSRCPLGMKPVLPGASLPLVFPRTVKILSVVMAG